MIKGQNLIGSLLNLFLPFPDDFSFSFLGTKRMIQLTYGIKQLIAREVEIEKMRLEGGSGKEPRSVTPTQEMDQDIEHTPRGSKKTTNHLQKLTAKPVEFKTKAPTDFFGRALKVFFRIFI